jgi:hypothetical protein
MARIPVEGKKRPVHGDVFLALCDTEHTTLRRGRIVTVTEVLI